MNQRIEVRIGKRYAIYLPKAVVKALGLREGDKVVLNISGNALIVEKIHDPIQLALSGSKFASVAPEQVETISLEEQGRYVKNSS